MHLNFNIHILCRKPVPKERVQKPKSQEEKRRTPQSVRDSDDEEVADAYKNRVNGRKSPSGK